MLGWDNIPESLTTGLDTQTKWNFTDYNFERLIDICEKLAREGVLKAGGRIEQEETSGEEIFLIPIQKPQPGPLEQSWKPGSLQNTVYPEPRLKTITVGSSRLAQAVPRFAPGWRLTSCKEEKLLGLVNNIQERPAALMLQSGDWMPCTLTKRVTLPAKQNSSLHLEVGSIPGKQWLLIVRVGGHELLRKDIGDEANPGGWVTLNVDLSEYHGKTILVEVSDMESSSTNRGALALISEISIHSSKP
ncbi:MAG: hypothetical protein IH586_03225, partial [Anaerolineaceae bacterium]|nr:hypothetical protein [Anaerolineaceae bacterium]